MRYKYIFFDLDGTLTDPALGICSCIQYALGKGGYEVGARERYFPWIGPPLLDSFMKFIGVERAEAERLLGFYRERFSVEGMFENEVYLGIPGLLAALKERGAKLAVATGKPTVYARPILEHFDLLKYFDFVSGSTIDGTIKYKETVLSIAMTELGAADKSQCVLIGDRDQDVEGARRNGIDCVYVLYGYGSREEAESCEAALIAEDMDALKRILL